MSTSTIASVFPVLGLRIIAGPLELRGEPITVEGLAPVRKLIGLDG